MVYGVVGCIFVWVFTGSALACGWLVGVVECYWFLGIVGLWLWVEL